MEDRVLVDTCVWIEFLKNPQSNLKEKLEDLLLSDNACTTGVIVQELIQGAKDRKELKIVEDLCRVLNVVEPSLDTFVKAGYLGFSLKKKGYTIPTIDLLIAQVCIENNLALFTFDKHFVHISRTSKLKLYKF